MISLSHANFSPQAAEASEQCVSQSPFPKKVWTPSVDVGVKANAGKSRKQEGDIPLSSRL